jgi:Peptidase A4 family
VSCRAGRRSGRRPGHRVTFLVLVCLVLAGCGSSRSSALSAAHPLNFGSFAGYTQFRPVRSVGAALTVPTITRQSGAGIASTWIGAQAASAGARAPFIQVGLNEVRQKGKPDQYFTFWTDTARSFLPVPLFPVHPADQLSASLVLVGHHWTVAISDLTSHRHARFTTDQEGHASFQAALWIQEDPLDPIHRRLAPYPQLAGLQIAGLTENGAAPSARLTNVQWMSRGEQVLTPTPLDHDAFAFALKLPSLNPPARRYLKLEQVLVDAGTQPQAELADATAATGHAQEISWAKHLAAALARGRNASTGPWPPAVTRILAGDAPIRRRVVDLTNQLANGPQSDFIATRARWAAAIRASALGSARLRRVLNAPSVQASAAKFSQLLQPR